MGTDAATKVHKCRPIGANSGSVQLEIRSGVSAASGVEEVVEQGVNGDGFLQTLNAPETKHCPLTSPNRPVRILCAVRYPTTFPPETDFRPADTTISRRAAP